MPEPSGRDTDSIISERGVMVGEVPVGPERGITRPLDRVARHEAGAVWANRFVAKAHATRPLPRA